MEMQIKECPLCKEELISELGLDCMMCGMPIDKGDFCSMKCEKMYWEIREHNSTENKKWGKQNE